MPGKSKWIHKGIPVKTGFFRDLSVATRADQRRTNNPEDWPWSKQARRKYGKNVAFNKSESVGVEDERYRLGDSYCHRVDSCHSGGNVNYDTEIQLERSEMSDHRSASEVLIDAVIEGYDPAELIEKVSYLYDIRLDQNIETSPVRKIYGGYFRTASAHNRVTEARKKRLPKAAYDLLKDASRYHPPQVKYMDKSRVKYIDDFVKRGWLTRTDVGSYQEGVKITKAGEEALRKDEW